jgi:hypothetical protein
MTARQLVYYTREEALDLLHDAKREMTVSEDWWRGAAEAVGQYLGSPHTSGIHILPETQEAAVEEKRQRYLEAVDNYTLVVTRLSSGLDAGAPFIGVYEIPPQDAESLRRASQVRDLVEEHLVATSNKQREAASQVRTWLEGQRARGLPYTMPPWMTDIDAFRGPKGAEAFADWAEQVLGTPEEDFVQQDRLRN